MALLHYEVKDSHRVLSEGGRAQVVYTKTHLPSSATGLKETWNPC